MGKLLGWLSHLVLDRPRWVAAGSAAMLVFGLVGLTRVTIDFIGRRPSKRGMRSAEAIRFLDRELGGYDWLTVVLEVPDGAQGDFLDPQKLQVAEEIQTLLQKAPWVGHVDSPIGVFKLANQVFNEHRPEEPRFADSRELAAQFMLLLEMGASPRSMACSPSTARIAQVSARLTSPGSRQVRSWLDELEPQVEAITSEAGLVGYVTGYSQIFSKLNKTIAMGLVSSLTGALLIIAVIMTLTLRSVRLGLASMMPNTIPVLVTLGLMGWVGIFLSGQTAMIGCIGLGLAVDDTIHFLHRFHVELERTGGDRREAVSRTLRSTGRAIIFTSLVLMAGFSLLVLSSMVQFTEFGLLTAVCMAAAILGDLLLLPVLLLGVPWLTAPEAQAAAAAASR